MMLTPEELAKRWGMSSRTLANWRSQRKGPPYVKLGQGRSASVLYPITGVEAYEKRHLKRGGK